MPLLTPRADIWTVHKEEFPLAGDESFKTTFERSAYTVHAHMHMQNSEY